MRQAGRYMPEFRKIRAKHSFLEVCHDPELAAEVTLLPIKAFNMDAAILFSDILVIPEAFNIGLRFEDQKGPVIDRPLCTPADIYSLPKIDIKHSLAFVEKTIKLLIPRLKVPLIGFCGAPFTIASYMIEGGSSRDLKKTKQWLLKDPESFHHLLQLITDYTIEYMQLQASAGIHAFQIFDSWASVLGHTQFREFSLKYLHRLTQSFKSTGIPLILFCRGSSIFASQLAEINPAAISIDWNGELAKIRAEIPATIALQGNLDPDILYAPRKLLKKEINQLLKSMHGDPGYIFNLGHGIHPDISVDAVKTLVETVQNYRL
jgi:uroporphyrinogen decarboxylase